VLQASVPVAGSGAAATVTAMSRALETACGELAERMRQTWVPPVAGGGIPEP
jgi:ABC-type uncharacterized transport system auxiliary subunit